jgi:hypothetical protein
MPLSLYLFVGAACRQEFDPITGSAWRGEPVLAYQRLIRLKSDRRHEIATPVAGRKRCHKGQQAYNAEKSDCSWPPLDHDPSHSSADPSTFGS